MEDLVEQYIIACRILQKDENYFKEMYLEKILRIKGY